jgi:predicted transcriptional regulator with HTH domain
MAGQGEFPDAEMQATLAAVQRLIDLGLVEVAGKDRNGETTYKLTDKGRKDYESL